MEIKLYAKDVLKAYRKSNSIAREHGRGLLGSIRPNVNPIL